MNNRQEQFMEEVDRWRNKFSHPLTREQAVDVILDEREFDEEVGEFTDTSLRYDVYSYRDFQKLCYDFKYKGER